MASEPMNSGGGDGSPPQDTGTRGPADACPPGSRPKPKACPDCGGAKVIPIVYGAPSSETLAAAKRGEVFLGGCSVEPWLPEWRCVLCGYEWIAGSGAEQTELNELLEYARRHRPRG